MNTSKCKFLWRAFGEMKIVTSLNNIISSWRISYIFKQVSSLLDPMDTMLRQHLHSAIEIRCIWCMTVTNSSGIVWQSMEQSIGCAKDMPIPNAKSKHSPDNLMAAILWKSKAIIHIPIYELNIKYKLTI